MTVRFDPNRLHAGRVTLSVYPGRGILAENAPSEGDNGPALGYRPEWFGKEVRAEVVTPPQHGTLELFEDTAIIYTGNGTPDTAELQWLLDGVAEPATEPLTFNQSAAEQHHSTSAGGNTLCGGTLNATFVNNQHAASAAGGNIVCSGTLSASVINDQNFVSSAGGGDVSGGTLATSYIDNSDTGIQHHSTSAGGNSLSGGTLSVSYINDQHVNSPAGGGDISAGTLATSYFDDSEPEPFTKVGLTAVLVKPNYSATLIQ